MAEEKSGGLVAGRAVEICANIDDMTGEDLGAAMELLLSAGALDVWFEQIQMKKNRPAVKLCALALPEDKERIAELVLRHTTTLGVRMNEVERLMLAREVRTIERDARVRRREEDSARDGAFDERRARGGGGRCGNSDTLRAASTSS